jgi:hypothetical protein
MAGALAVCRGCGAPIRWAATAAGRRLPLDPEPAADGTVVLGPTGTAHVLPARGRGDVPPEVERYRPHWATCPRAGDFRRGRGRG